MKRELEESPDDERRQASVAALVQADFVFGLREIPELLEAFQFHPQRLLRLIQASPRFGRAVEQAVAQYPRLWYDYVLHAFPDVVVLLQVYGPQDYDTNKIVKVDGWFQWLSSLADRQLYYMQPRDPIDVASRLKLLYNHRAGGLSCCEDRIDRTFHDPVLLHRCMHDEAVARHTAQCFKLLAPFGVPPAQYCFASQLALHHLTVAFLAALQNGPRQRAVMDDIQREFTLIPGDAEEGRANGWMQRVTLGQCAATLVAPQGQAVLFEADGDGPRTGHFNQIHTKWSAANVKTNEHLEHVFELDDLAGMVLKLLMISNGATQVALTRIYGAIVRAMLRYATDLPPALPVWPRREKPDEPIVGRDEIVAQRQRDLERYGSHDPLQWRVLLSGEEDAYGLTDDWKHVLVDAIATTKALMDPQSEPVLQLQCRACGSSGPHCGVEEVAPYNAYCTIECQKKDRGVY